MVGKGKFLFYGKTCIVDLSFNLAWEQNLALWDLEGKGPVHIPARRAPACLPALGQEQSNDLSKCPAPSKLTGQLRNSRFMYLSSQCIAFCSPEKPSDERLINLRPVSTTNRPLEVKAAIPVW